MLDTGTAPFELRGRPTATGCECWAVTPEGTIAMSADIELERTGR